MFRIAAALLLWFVAATVAPAQERQARVVMDDGRVLEGTVLAIDLGALQMRVGDEVLTLATEHVQSCRFAAEDAGEASPHEQDPPPAPAGAGTDDSAGDDEEAAEDGTAQEPPPSPAGETAKPGAPAGKAPEGGTKAAPKRRAPQVAPQDPAEATPAPAGRRSLVRERLEAIDAYYPWLVPTEPTQWISLGLLLFACLLLIVHMSVHVVGAESPGFGRSMGLALWYELTGFLQFAMVPSAHVSTFIMLIGNTALALFWLRNLFAVSRGGAVVSLAVQLGFCVLGYGVLELVTSLLGSIEPIPA